MIVVCVCVWYSVYIALDTRERDLDYPSSKSKLLCGPPTRCYSCTDIGTEDRNNSKYVRT